MGLILYSKSGDDEKRNQQYAYFSVWTYLFSEHSKRIAYSSYIARSNSQLALATNGEFVYGDFLFKFQRALTQFIINIILCKTFLILN
jgi:hypothetical protein